MALLPMCMTVTIDAPAMAADNKATTSDGDASYISIPVKVSLSNIFAAADKQAPRQIGTNGQWVSVDGQPAFEMKYTVQRDPLHLSLQGATVTASVPLHFSMQVRNKTFHGLGASCGTNGESSRRAMLSLTSVLAVGPDWSLSAATTTQVNAIDRCKITFLNVDITNQIMSAAQNQIGSAVKSRVDDAVTRSAALQAVSRRLWQTLQQPISLQQDLWLCVQPDQISLAGLAGSGDTLQASISMTAHPKVILGAKPTAATLPLPPLGSQSPGSGFHVSVEADLPYADLSRDLYQALAVDPVTHQPKVYSYQGVNATITAVRLTGSGDNTSAELDFAPDPNTKATIHVSGKINFDPVAGILSFSVADISAVSNVLFLQNILNNPQNTADIKTKIEAQRLPVNQRLQGLQARLESAFSRNFAQNISSRGTITALTLVGVTSTQDALHVKVLLTGTLEIEVNPLLAQVPKSRSDYCCMPVSAFLTQ